MPFSKSSVLENLTLGIIMLIKYIKTFIRANSEVINAQLYMDWEILFGDSYMNDCLDKFYSVLHSVIDINVPNQRSTPSTYPLERLKKMSFFKKAFSPPETNFECVP